jgi:hypothetical protein
MHSSEQARPQRRKLVPRNPFVEPLVHDLGVAGADLDETRAFALQLYRDRNRWSVARGKASVERPISREQAEQELKRALGALWGGQNHG